MHGLFIKKIYNIKINVKDLEIKIIEKIVIKTLLNVIEVTNYYSSYIFISMFKLKKVTNYKS